MRYPERLLFILLMVFVVMACGPREGTKVGTSANERWLDPDYKVVCWVYHSGYAGGLACLPESQVEPR